MIGLSNAVEMVSSGENVDAKTAFQMGLVSDVVASEKLREAAIKLIPPRINRSSISKIANAGTVHCRWTRPS